LQPRLSFFDGFRVSVVTTVVNTVKQTDRQNAINA
jgi:hypothetical protein